MINTLANSPDAPQKVSAIPGLGKKIMTALAALGIAASAEKVEGAVVLNGLSKSSSISGPALQPLQPGSDVTELINTTTQNSRLFTGNFVNGSDTAISRFTITLSPTDVVGAGGTLTLTGNLQLSTQNDVTSGQGFAVAGSSYSVSQQVQWGKNGDPMTTLASINSPILNNNDADEELSSGEKWYSGLTPAFSVNIPITSSGEYYLDNVLIRNNVSGAAALSNFTMTYTPIPEPSTGIIAGGLLGAALLRRRRESQEKQ